MMSAPERESGGRGCRPCSVVLTTITTLCSVALLSLVTGCPEAVPNGQDPNTNGGSDQARDCVGCHTDETLLKAVAREDEPPAEDAGEG
jgi:hypothetical protein